MERSAVAAYGDPQRSTWPDTRQAIPLRVPPRRFALVAAAVPRTAGARSGIATARARAVHTAPARRPPGPRGGRAADARACGRGRASVAWREAVAIAGQRLAFAPWVAHLGPAHGRPQKKAQAR